jgi:RNA polymerase sigma factor (sigma-70 family)
MYSAFDVKRNANVPRTDDANGRYTGPTKEDYGNGSQKDPGDIAGLVDKYGGLVYWVSRYVTGDSKDAEEVLQKTFLEAQSGFTDSKQNESLVMRLARFAVDESFAKLSNRNASQLLRLSLEVEADGVFEPQEIVDWVDDAEKCYAREELHRTVHEGVQSLTPFSRVVFLLRDVGHLKPEEIAAIFRVSVPHVKAHLLRSRLQLREHLNKYLKSHLREKAQTA